MRQSFSDVGESSRSGKWFGEDDICPNCFKKSEKQSKLMHGDSDSDNDSDK